VGARHFTSTDHISLSLGALGFVFGPGTIAAVVRRSVDGADHDAFSVGTTASGVNVAMFVNGTTNVLTLFVGPALGGSGTGITIAAADGWQLLAMSKASGSVAARGHRYVYTTGVWTHTNSGTARANPPAPTTAAEIGQDFGGGSNWNGDIAVVGTWNTVLSDADVEKLLLDTSFTAWNSFPGLKGHWSLTQDVTAQTVTDATGGGANQSAISGTSVVADSPFLQPPPPKADRRELVYMRRNQ
jgi:hypothetical protein